MRWKVAAALCLTLVLCIGAAQQFAHGQGKYPSKRLTYLVCFDPGGQSDRTARQQQAPLQKLLGQQVIIDYKVGGGGALGWRELVRAKPDGYTIAGFNIPHVILQPLQQEVGYTTEQIEPVAIFQRTPLAITVLNTSPFKTMQDLIDHAKKNPGAVTLGGSGTFTGYQMATLRLEKLTGARYTYVPFNGSAPQITAWLGGHVTAIWGNTDDLVRYKDKARLLGFASEKRFPDFPDVPTLKELGLDLAEAIDRGVAVPPKTPPAIIKKLEAAFLEIANKPEIQAEMKAQGFVSVAMGQEESKAYLQKMTAIYKEASAGLK